MAMTISTQVAQMSPTFLDGKDTPSSETTTGAPKNVTVSNIDSNSITIGGE